MDRNLTRGALLGMLLIVTAVFWPTLQQLHLRWVQMDNTYAYGYFLLALAGFIVHQRIQQHRHTDRRPVWLGGVASLLASVVWLAGYLTQTQLLEQVALPIIIWGWVLVYFGWRFARAVVPAFVLVYFTIPLWDVLVDPLRIITVIVVQWWIRLLDIPVFIDGFVIEVPAGTFVVAGGCSGLNTLLMGVVISAFYAAQYLRSYRRVLCVVLMVGLALVGNWVRVFLLVLIGYYSDMQNPLVYDHLAFGWAVFVVCLLVFFFLLRFIDGDGTTGADAGVAPAVAGGIGPAVGAVALLIAVVLSISPPVWARLQGAGDGSAGTGIALASEASLRPVPADRWIPDYRGYDVLQQWAGDIAGLPAVLTALTYLQQRQGKELIYFANRLADEDRERRLPPLVLANGLKVGRSIVSGSRGPSLVLWTYRVGDWHTLSDLYAKLLQIPSRFAGEPAAGLLVVTLRCRQTRCRRLLQLAEGENFSAELAATLDGVRWTYR
ncbi:exosortase [Exilibacterium tricleocarpae]|uniref:Exosortase n=1 Tax=Exilibacterium tricleocarpae TaxID=2591008 RepID=A0A545T3H2_9GAMM|nr:exosortase A [Exilibacterium tricleocarpae]TQV71760.1 exosortase [Exilibacterium tricleocarpae]